VIAANILRTSYSALLAAVLLFAGAGSAMAAAFGFDDVAKQAAALSAKSYNASSTAMPEELARLDYDQYRDIRFKPERALWRAEKLPFELMFFHPGRPYSQPVRINEISAQGVRRIAFDTSAFDYGKNKLTPNKAWGDVGFAGFRVHTALNTPDYKDELVVFLGASYLRALGKDQHYGLSARGLGIDTVGGKGEEFPRFTEFWIERPTADAKQLVVYALLESPRATGAYQIILKPGENTAADVKARLFLRAGVATLGIAPLTSMFQHGENQPNLDDFRPEVHDSDGLMVATGDGEWLWRPLNNPKRTLVTSFAVKDLKGFGLMQRDRAFTSYQDTEARYERRPSAWITPVGSWGPGRVELMQFNTVDETNDNVTAYWVPERVPAPGQPLDVAYRMSWQGKDQQRPPNAWTVQSRSGQGVAKLPRDEVQYVVDFDGPALKNIADPSKVKAVVTAGSNGRLIESNAYRNDAADGWRMTLRVKRIDVRQPVELRAFLQQDSHALTETWTSLIQPD
jgi:glucans biosynthesis protein